jgi:putative NIF3 family GTP cyclohydrolase 1 type 2
VLTKQTVLLEAPFEPTRRQKNSVLLAIDLTTAVADEAVKRQDSAVVAYRKIGSPMCI